MDSHPLSRNHPRAYNPGNWYEIYGTDPSYFPNASVTLCQALPYFLDIPLN